MSDNWSKRGLPIGLFLGGLLLYFHVRILDLLGRAGGFQFLRKVTPIYFAIGALSLAGTYYWDDFDVRVAVLTAVVSQPLVLGGILLLPGEGIFSRFDRFLLYGPTALALPIGVAHALSREKATYLLLGAVCVVWAVLTGLVLQNAPRGPIGLYLTFNFAFAAIFALPIYLTGRVVARPNPDQ